MNDLWDKLTNNVITSVVFMLCATILGCALIFGAYSCINAEYQYNLKRIELIKPR
jgi:hypothetical protein